MSAYIYTVQQNSFAEYLLLNYWKPPTVESVSIARLFGTAATQRGLQELLSNWKLHCVPLPPGQVKSSGNFHLCYQTILPPGQASNFTADNFSCQPHSSASKAQQDLLPRVTQLWLQCTNPDHAVPWGRSNNCPFPLLQWFNFCYHHN